jgi:subtilase family serine protease
MNIGSEDASKFAIGFYLSKDEKITASDVLLGVNWGASAPTGVVGSGSRSLKIPSNTGPGTYYLGILLDPYNAVTEWNDNNNDMPQPRPVTIY